MKASICAFAFALRQGSPMGILAKLSSPLSRYTSLLTGLSKVGRMKLCCKKKSKILPIIALNIIKLFYLAFIYVCVNFFLKKLLFYMIFFSSIFPPAFHYLLKILQYLFSFFKISLHLHQLLG